MRRAGEAVRLAFSWLTVLPVGGPAAVDRRSAARAITAAPLTGLALGAVVAALLWLLTAVGLAPPLAGILTVGAHALVTRGMHIDGLSDTFDGLGCYGPPERAQEVMHSGGAGPFGVATLVVCLGAQAWAFAELASAGRWGALVLVVFAGRVAVVIACRRGTPAASDRGFGALVAGTQGPVAIGAWTAITLVASAWCASPPWFGPVVTAAVLGATVFFVRHCIRRFGGLGGDVLGATLELGVTALAVTLSAAGG